MAVTCTGCQCIRMFCFSECNCNPNGAKEVPGYPLGGCGEVITGRLCECKERVIGRICDTCIPGYWNLHRNNPLGCEGERTALWYSNTVLKPTKAFYTVVQKNMFKQWVAIKNVTERVLVESSTRILSTSLDLSK